LFYPIGLPLRSDNPLLFTTETDPTEETLEKAALRAKELDCPLILASTTGASAKKALTLAEAENIHLIVITHHEGALPKGGGFSKGILDQLKVSGHSVLPNQPALPLPVQFLRRCSRFVRWNIFNRREAVLEEAIGTGGRVCFAITKLAFNHGRLKAGDVVVAVGGQEAGLNTALVLQVRGQRFCVISLLETITMPSALSKQKAYSEDN